MGKIATAVTIFLGSSLLGQSAWAAVIDFGGLVSPNTTPFSASYVEDGFTVTPSSGWFEGHIFGNPVPSIYGGPLYGSNTGSITVTGGTFSLSSIDFSSNSVSGTSYTMVGTLGGVNVLNSSGVLSTGWATYLSGNSAAMDTLSVTLTAGPGVTSFNIDNISVTPVPVAAPVPVLTAVPTLSFWMIAILSSLLTLVAPWRRR